MYNNIGLLTPRGTGTSGHVQANKFNLTRAPVPKFEEGQQSGVPPATKQPNKAILEHNRKRQIEVQLCEYQDQLEDQGLSTEQVEAAIDSKRAELLQQFEQERALAADKFSNETHATAQRKQEQLERVRKAFGLGEEVLGEAAHPHKHSQKRQEYSDKTQAEEALAIKHRRVTSKEKHEHGQHHVQQHNTALKGGEQQPRAAGDRHKQENSGGRQAQRAAPGKEQHSRASDRVRGQQGTRRSSYHHVPDGQDYHMHHDAAPARWKDGSDDER